MNELVSTATTYTDVYARYGYVYVAKLRCSIHDVHTYLAYLPLSYTPDMTAVLATYLFLIASTQILVVTEWINIFRFPHSLFQITYFMTAKEFGLVYRSSPSRPSQFLNLNEIFLK